MTRKEALKIAIHTADDNLKAKLQEILNDMPLTNWTKKYF
jgi:hypothetical protein